MPARQSPSKNQFVVRVSDTALPELRARLTNLGTVERLKGTNLVLVRTKDVASDPKTAWSQIVERVGADRWVAPILLDQEEQEHYPTGDISVRFDRPPSAGDLERFAQDHDLVLQKRNEFIPEQVGFQPAHPSATYLPDLIDSLSGEDGVKAAWANTASDYRRI